MRGYLKYEPLPNRHIRLVKIHESSSPPTPTELLENNDLGLDDDIEISLITVPLAQCQPYVALSYTWGDAQLCPDPTSAIFTTVQRCFPIWCRNRLIRSTRNPRDALRRLRQFEQTNKYISANVDLDKSTKPKPSVTGDVYTYWIDLICINQDDPSERSNQVILMDEIYRNARSTIAWLGESDRHTFMALKTLTKLLDKVECGFDTIDAESFIEENLKYQGLSSVSHAEVAALGMLLTRNWISRTWILQELALSTNVWVICGRLLCDFGQFTKASALISSAHESKSLAAILGHEMRESYSKDFLGLMFERSLRAITTLASLFYIRFNLGGPNRKPDFMTTIAMSRSSQATDPRDKIFGILGVAAEFDQLSEEDKKPDYNLTTAQVYLNTTRSIIRVRGDLACLSLVCDSRYKLREGLPSWCPDYNAPEPGLQHFSDIQRKSWDLKISWPDAKLPFGCDQSSILTVDGCRLDTILEVSNIETCGLSGVFRLATRLDSSQTLANRGYGQYETLWRTLFQDFFDEISPAPAIAARFVPSFIMMCLQLHYGWRIDGSQANYGTKQQIALLEELQRLEEAVDQLKIQQQTNSIPHIPDINHIREAIEQDIKQAGQRNNSETMSPRIQWSAFETEVLACTLELFKHKQETDKTRDRQLGLSESELRVLLEKYRSTMNNQIGIDTMGGRKYFRTKRHTLGMGDSAIEPGDEVWVLFGATAPVFLRSLPNGNYRFLGEAFVDGYMRGEARERYTTHHCITLE